MLRKHIAACLAATALVAGPALAEVGSAAAQTASPPAAQASAGKFMTQQSAQQWRASKLVGLNVYSTNNERIGDVNDVLLDRNGNAEAVVIGVGGFLGIGEKDVAIPFKSVEWKMTSDTARTSANTSAPAPAGTAANPQAGANTTGSTAAGPNANTNANTTRSTMASDANRGYPDHAVLAMSKADLQNAPAFHYAGSTASGSSTGGANAPANTPARQ
jgi:sporulation protein YlmC with PRC-barrel domain